MTWTGGPPEFRAGLRAGRAGGDGLLVVVVAADRCCEASGRLEDGTAGGGDGCGCGTSCTSVLLVLRFRRLAEFEVARKIQDMPVPLVEEESGMVCEAWAECPSSAVICALWVMADVEGRVGVGSSEPDIAPVVL